MNAKLIASIMLAGLAVVFISIKKLWKTNKAQVCKKEIIKMIRAKLVKLDDQVFLAVLPKALNPCASADLLDSGSRLRRARNEGRLCPVGGKNLIIE